MEFVVGFFSLRFALHCLFLIPSCIDFGIGLPFLSLYSLDLTCFWQAQTVSDYVYMILGTSGFCWVILRVVWLFHGLWPRGALGLSIRFVNASFMTLVMMQLVFLDFVIWGPLARFINALFMTLVDEMYFGLLDLDSPSPTG